MTTPTIEARVQDAMRKAQQAVRWAHDGIASDQWLEELEADIRSLAASPSWRCFHCDESFTDEAAARDHFGSTEAQHPACTINASEYRRMEETHRRHCEEDTDLHRDIHRLQAEHTVALQREEEKGYARGLADGRSLAASATQVPPTPQAATQGETVSSEEREIRRMLCIAWAGFRAYMDDGEASDAESGIDFLRDSSAEIYRKQQKWLAKQFAARADEVASASAPPKKRSSKPLTVINEPAPAPSKEQTNG